MKVTAFNGDSCGGVNSQNLLLPEAVRGVKEHGAEVTVYIMNDANIQLCQNSGSCDRKTRNAR